MKKKRNLSFQLNRTSSSLIERYKISNVKLCWNTRLTGSGRRAGGNNHVEIDPCIYRYRGFNCRKKQFFSRSYRNNLNSAWKKINAVSSSVYYERIVFSPTAFVRFRGVQNTSTETQFNVYTTCTRLIRGVVSWMWDCGMEERRGKMGEMGHN